MYYVYALIDPRTKTPFYIGKGKDGRIHRHEKDAKNGESPRHLIIREIWGYGLEVEKRICKTFNIEDDAYSYEKRLIDRIGLKTLVIKQ